MKNSIDTPSYVTSGVEQFFLPELPNWANFSTSGACYKSVSFHYLDFSKISVAYKLSYHELVELQAQYNEKLENYFKSTTLRFLKPVEESSFFSNTLEQVRGGIYRLKLPNVNEVDVIWLESYIQNNKEDELIKFTQSDRYTEKLPILYSSCLSRQGLTQWLLEHGLDNAGFYLISADWLTPYGSDLTLRPALELNLHKIIDAKIKINIVTPVGAKLPTELILTKGDL